MSSDNPEPEFTLVNRRTKQQRSRIVSPPSTLETPARPPSRQSTILELTRRQLQFIDNDSLFPELDTPIIETLLRTVLPTRTNTKSSDDDSSSSDASNDNSSDDDSSNSDAMKYTDIINHASRVIELLEEPPEISIYPYNKWRATVGGLLGTVITPRTGAAGLCHLVDTKTMDNSRCGTSATPVPVPDRTELPVAGTDAATAKAETTQHLIELSVDKLLVA